MHPQVIHALLSDSNGAVLLVRRKGAVLLSLPGGDVRGIERLQELLTTLCTRQVGVAPDFLQPITQFTLAEKRVALAFAEILHARAGARGRVEAVFWVRPEKLPPEVDPIARYAVALYEQNRRTRAMTRPSGISSPGMHFPESARGAFAFQGA
jgi:ADP-ribose pyrophosphatase YjhB (NUDIX family)